MQRNLVRLEHEDRQIGRLWLLSASIASLPINQAAVSRSTSIVLSAHTVTVACTTAGCRLPQPMHLVLDLARTQAPCCKTRASSFLLSPSTLLSALANVISYRSRRCRPGMHAPEVVPKRARQGTRKGERRAQALVRRQRMSTWSSRRVLDAGRLCPGGARDPSCVSENSASCCEGCARVVRCRASGG